MEKIGKILLGVTIEDMIISYIGNKNVLVLHNNENDFNILEIKDRIISRELLHITVKYLESINDSMRSYDRAESFYVLDSNIVKGIFKNTTRVLKDEFGSTTILLFYNDICKFMIKNNINILDIDVSLSFEEYFTILIKKYPNVIEIFKKYENNMPDGFLDNFSSLIKSDEYGMFEVKKYNKWKNGSKRIK